MSVSLERRRSSFPPTPKSIYNLAAHLPAENLRRQSAPSVRRLVRVARNSVVSVYEGAATGVSTAAWFAGEPRTQNSTSRRLQRQLERRSFPQRHQRWTGYRSGVRVEQVTAAGSALNRLQQRGQRWTGYSSEVSEVNVEQVTAAGYSAMVSMQRGLRLGRRRCPLNASSEVLKDTCSQLLLDNRSISLLMSISLMYFSLVSSSWAH